MSEINIDNYLSTDLSAFEEQYLSTESYLAESISAMFKDRYFDLVDIQLDKKQEVHNKKFNVSIVQMPSNCLDKVSQNAVKLLANGNSIDAGGLRIVNCAEPDISSDAATKKYVSQKLSSLFADVETPLELDCMMLSCVEDNGQQTTYRVFVADGVLSAERMDLQPLRIARPIFRSAVMLQAQPEQQALSTEIQQEDEENTPKRKRRRAKRNVEISSNVNMTNENN